METGKKIGAAKLRSFKLLSLAGLKDFTTSFLLGSFEIDLDTRA